MDLTTLALELADKAKYNEGGGLSGGAVVCIVVLAILFLFGGGKDKK